MVVLGIDSCRFARVMLTAILALTTAARGSAGEALVLHQHGARRAHLHVLGYAQLSQDLASSALAGVSPNPQKAEPGLGGVQVLAIILTGRAAIMDLPESIPLPHNSASLGTVRPLVIAPAGGVISTGEIPAARTASTAILLRNHSLLL